ncbi:MAG: class I SAM-dependent methyltransferase [Bacteroidota bacterium]
MSKQKKLTDEEVANYRINPAVLGMIERYCHENNVTKEDLRILDYGSGKGKSVAVLRNMGFATFGVEIDPLPFNNGLDYFIQNGYDPNCFLFLMGKDCKTPFDDAFFDIIFSEQVFEHVENMEIVVREISRLSKRGALHIHTFPAKYHLIEQHLFMPLIHWLPKNRMRRWVIFLSTKFGKEPFWEPLEGKSVKEKTRIYYNYSIQRTHYRSVRQITKILERYGFSTDYKYFYINRTGIKGKIHRFFPSQVQLNLRKLRSTATAW